MGLKPHRNVIEDDISYFMNATGERGVMVFAVTGTYGTGAGVDSANRVAEIVTNPSGRLSVGMLLNDMVNRDISREIPEVYKFEQQVGTKCHLAVQGVLVTNMIGAGQASGALQYPIAAYAGTRGFLYSSAGYAASGWPVVGKFLTGVDTQGYAQVRIDV